MVRNTKLTQKGFTLIELLVVIAIIGILATIVLAALSTARAKGSDAAIKANLANTRAQAELFYDNSGNYGDTVATGDCPTTGTTLFAASPVVQSAIAAAMAANGGTSPQCAAAAPSGTVATSWAISSVLKTGGTWCVDSSGKSTSGLVAGSSAGVASCR